MTQGSQTIEPGTILAGRYRVERRLGEGGMGSVFLVEHVHTDQKLAVKILHAAVVKDAATLDRFRREARTPARINSDHVVQVTDADVAPELGGVPFLVMEWLRGQDLGQLCEARGRLPPREVLLYLQQAARALDKAHALGIIHRDLKPENLFLTAREDGTPLIKLLDFGIAKLTGASGDIASIGSVTSTGQVFGTPLYMAPEQAKAELSKISPMTDVWALGLIAHKLLMGSDFWSAETLTHLLAQIAYEPIPVPSSRGVPFGKEYDAWFLRCCSRDVEKRYSSAGEAVAALASALGLQDALAAISTSGSGVLRPSGAPPEPTAPREKSGDASAFAETAIDSPSGAQSISQLMAGDSVAGSSAAPAFAVGSVGGPAKAARSRLGIGLGTAIVVLAGALGIWIAFGRTSGPGPEETTPLQAQAGARGTSAGDTASSVMVTPSPGASDGAPSVAATSTAMAAPQAAATSIASARPAEPPEKADPRIGGSKPPSTGAPSARASVAPAAPAAPAATPVTPAIPATAKAGNPDNPLENRH